MNTFKLTFLIIASIAQLSSYCCANILKVDGDLGDPCTQPTDCKNQDKTTCDTNICVCNPDHVEFEEGDGTKSCLPKANLIGDECTQDIQCTVNLGDNTICGGAGFGCVCTPQFTPSSDRLRCLLIANELDGSCEEVQQCREGSPGPLSECLSNGTCHCSTGAINEPGQHVCLKIAEEIGDACTAAVQCTASLGDLSECSKDTQTCNCKANQGVPNAANDRCLKIINNLEGDVCQEKQQCQAGNPGPHSDCLESDSEAGKFVCRCLPDMIANQNKCLKKADLVGEDCEINDQCTAKLGPFSQCSSKKCSCIDNLGVPSAANDKCLEIINKLGDKCDEAPQCQEGVPGEHSDCVDSSTPGEKVCGCKPGMVDANDKCFQTVGLVGESCVIDDQCTATLGNLGECSPNTKTCECKSKLGVPNVAKDECLEVINNLNSAECTESQQCQVGSPGVHSECVESLSDPTKKVCTCKAETIIQGNRCLKMAKEIGEGCEINSQCTDKLGDLSECSLFTWKCACKDKQGVPDSSNKSCLKVINELNSATCEEPQQCQGGLPGQYSDCMGEPGKKVCMCQAGILEDNNRCLKAAQDFGEACEAHSQCSANLGEFSECAETENKCQCNKDGVQKPGDKKCIEKSRSLAASCEHTVQCPLNAECTPDSGSSNQDICQCKGEHVPSTNKTLCLPVIKTNLSKIKKL